MQIRNVRFSALKDAVLSLKQNKNKIILDTERKGKLEVKEYNFGFPKQVNGSILHFDVHTRDYAEHFYPIKFTIRLLENTTYNCSESLKIHIN